VRPKSIVWFERLIFSTLLLGAIQSYLSWDETVALESQANSNPAAFTAFVQVGVFLIIGTLTLLISRRRSKVAMWVSIALFVLGLPVFFTLLARGLVIGLGVITVAQTLGQVIAYGLLFTPSSRRWMRGDEQLDEVFS